MRHVPHLLLPEPWGDSIEVGDDQGRHLRKVLRVADGAEVHYTDGAGRVGVGSFADGLVTRGDERFVAAPPVLDLVVAPPKHKDRVRFLVEKVAELGATSLRWIRTDRTQVPPPQPEKAQAWADGALEQSRGAWRLRIGTTSWDELEDGDGRLLVAERGGMPLTPGLLPATIVIGPEGGISREETPNRGEAVTLGEHILRTETAAMVAVALARAPK